MRLFSSASIVLLLVVHATKAHDPSSVATPIIIGKHVHVDPHGQELPKFQLTHSIARDIVYDSVYRFALQSLQETAEHGDDALHDYSIGTSHHFCMTIMGSKSGYYSGVTDPELEMNQDRTFVASSKVLQAVAVLDGHGTKGHYVSEFGTQGLLKRLQQGLELATTTTSPNETLSAYWVNALHEIDAAIPQAMGDSGGATVSMGLFQNDSFVFINAGDSQTVLGAVYQHENNTRQVIKLFETRLDKPSDPDERARILRDHPTARIDDESSSDVARVWSPNGYGLAMTRAIGDAGSEAVIATPIVTVLKRQDMMQLVMELLLQTSAGSCVVKDTGSTDCQKIEFDSDKVDFFMYSATDGVLDYMETPELTQRVGDALMGGGGGSSTHPFLLVRDILLECKYRWKVDSPRYRDDMAIAVANIAL